MKDRNSKHCHFFVLLFFAGFHTNERRLTEKPLSNETFTTPSVHHPRQHPGRDRFRDSTPSNG
ncbi:hypothetical protein Pla52o_02930 [Novipirellula galeiformis]|uniref:Uncharacterized protein n=1 Tax=Novipirellula galeiformis TaxID=2528004 RepID=A0A5C6CPH9_9BACT|nr:hypothetical protein Pla52o_02930 [Novipirellula galeiformis]